MAKDSRKIEQAYIDSHYGVVTHRDFVPLYADDNYAHYFGLGCAQDVLELPSLLPLIAPADRELAKQNYKKVMAGEIPPSVRSYHNINQYGEEFTVLTVDHIVEWEGEPALQITLIDLSSQLEMNRKLVEREQRYRGLVEGSIQGLLVHRNFKPLFANQSYLDIFGFESQQDLLELPSILTLIPEDVHALAVEHNTELLNGGLSSVRTEAQGRRIDGSLLWLSFLSSPVQWEGEDAIQVAVMDITEQYQLRQQLEHNANYDELTGLLNRRALSALLSDAFSKAQAGMVRLSCIMLDLDNFKLINDQHGHDIGDEVLKNFALVGEHALREQDVLGRWGGEEFVVMLPDTDLLRAGKVAQRLLDAIQDAAVPTRKGAISYTATLGVATYQSGVASVEQLLSQADNALYKGKEAGKNRVVLASD